MQQEWLRWEPAASLKLGSWVASSPRLPAPPASALLARQRSGTASCFLSDARLDLNPRLSPSILKLRAVFSGPSKLYSLLLTKATSSVRPTQGGAGNYGPPVARVSAPPSMLFLVGERVHGQRFPSQRLCRILDARSSSGKFPILCSKSVRFQQRCPIAFVSGPTNLGG